MYDVCILYYFFKAHLINKKSLISHELYVLVCALKVTHISWREGGRGEGGSRGREREKTKRRREGVRRDRKRKRKRERLICMLVQPLSRLYNNSCPHDSPMHTANT